MWQRFGGAFLLFRHHHLSHWHGDSQGGTLVISREFLQDPQILAASLGRSSACAFLSTEKKLWKVSEEVVRGQARSPFCVWS